MLRKTLKTLLAVGVAVAITGPGFAQSKTNFSGTWKLNVDKSDFGPVPGPTAQTDVIDQSGDTLKINVTSEGDQGKVQFTENFTADGNEVTIAADSPVAHPAPEVTLQSITASWDGPALKLEQKLLYGSEPVTGVSHYTLSADGKVLTIASDYQSAMGPASRTFIFEKQDASMASGSSSATTSSGSTPSAPTSMAATTDSPASSNASTSSSARPNLSGTWVLDKSKSEFGPMPPPDTRTDTIDDKGATVKIVVNQSGAMGATSVTLDLVTDGKQTATSTMMGSPASSTAHWEGNTLVVNTQIDRQGTPVSLVSRYVLSADGNTLTVTRDISTQMGDLQQKWVFAKK